VAALPLLDFLKHVPSFLERTRDKDMTRWDVVAKLMNLDDSTKVYQRAQNLKLHKTLPSFKSETLMAPALLTTWKANVTARKAAAALVVGGLGVFATDAEAELSTFLSTHEGVLSIYGWQMLAIRTCPILVLRGYEPDDLSRKVTQLQGSAMRAVQ